MLARSLAVFALAAPLAALAADLEQLRAKVQSQLTGEHRVTGVSATPYAGVFEVVINGNELGYTNAGGEIFIAGALFDLKTNTNVSERRLAELRKVDFARLPLDKAIVKVKGNGKRRLAVFSDPDCPFCKRLEPELDKLSDVTIYTFLYPIASLHPDALRKATLVWCADDRVRAWDDLMQRGAMPQRAALGCATPILEIIDLAERLGINATPGIVFPDGKLMPGYMPADRIEAELGAAG
jgi:thiol:disulfide interchange protein DsbC